MNLMAYEIMQNFPPVDLKEVLAGIHYSLQACFLSVYNALRNLGLVLWAAT